MGLVSGPALDTGLTRMDNSVWAVKLQCGEGERQTDSSYRAVQGALGTQQRYLNLKMSQTELGLSAVFLS